ncbi:peptidase M20 [Sphingomonas oleivorans]|uniref:Peptidase M20 n=2 Tax=Sphingomonas oleivorans TaxID=1735121 RepID=A0A2T5G2Z0_9SPHN|nr:M20 aminoacylase family protein [Sphingomonas oleivorans]PTQ13517.1 peptidase M20 [Sphingomonas oleivorans]
MPDGKAGIEELIAPLVAFRRDIHAHPELGFAEHRTAAAIAEQLRAIGLEVESGIGGTGVVGVLRNGDGKGSLGFRADMDALPIHEDTGLDYASRTPGIFHGCGHDGHVATLLGAARHLARTRHFNGTINFIFQPAEEGLGGAHKMIEDGLFDRFPCDQVYALHNWPDLPAGSARTRPGPIMAAADKFEILVSGRGGHAALPHQTPDAIVAASELALQLNMIVSRRIPPTSSAVLSVTQIAGGHAHNVLPAEVRLAGTVRTFDPAVQDVIEAALRDIAAGVALASGTRIDVSYNRYYPATINDAECAAHALAAAAAVCGDAAFAPDPAYTSEDFAFMLQARPGAYLWLGQGRPGKEAPLHHPHYDFNDEVIGTGIAWFTELAERLLPA